MKIAIMMRPMDQDTGLGIYLKALLEKMLEIDQDNFYLLLYHKPRWYGTFSEYRNVKEVLLPSPHKLLWDQLLVPYKAWREGADIIYNVKFSVPLVSHCPVAMGLHEPAWWAWPEFHTRFDVRYMKAMLPLYCRKSKHFFPWSNFQVEETRKYLGLKLDNVSIVPPGYSPLFRPLEDEAALSAFREERGLPDEFILSITRVENLGNSSATFSSTKNVETTVKAYSLIREQIPHKLVIVGHRVREYLEYQGFTEADLEGIFFTGLVPHEDIPMYYNCADLFVLPSFYEGFGMNLLEAMACGCPIVASNTGSCSEVTDGAALLANPYEPEEFAAKVMMIVNDDSLREELRDKGLQRSKLFSWERTARVVLDGLAQAAGKVEHRHPERSGSYGSR